MKSGLQGEFSKQNYDTWVKPVQLELFTGDVLTIAVPNQHYVDFFNDEPEERIRPFLRQARSAGLRVSEVTFVAMDKKAVKAARSP